MLVLERPITPAQIVVAPARLGIDPAREPVPLPHQCLVRKIDDAVVVQLGAMLQEADAWRGEGTDDRHERLPARPESARLCDAAEPLRASYVLPAVGRAAPFGDRREKRFDQCDPFL